MAPALLDLATLAALLLIDWTLSPKAQPRDGWFAGLTLIAARAAAVFALAWAFRSAPGALMGAAACGWLAVRLAQEFRASQADAAIGTTAATVGSGAALALAWAEVTVAMAGQARHAPWLAAWVVVFAPLAAMALGPRVMARITGPRWPRWLAIALVAAAAAAMAWEAAHGFAPAMIPPPPSWFAPYASPLG